MVPAIALTNVFKRFGSLQALRGVSLQIEQGEFFALLGPNGAGKSTLINILGGLTKANSGLIQVMGHNVTNDYRQSRKLLGVVPQELVYDPFFTVMETLRIQSGYFGIRKNQQWIDEVIHQLGLTEKANVNMRALSGGMKRRVLVAQALVHKPQVIVLDEPTAGVDVELRQTLWKFIKKLNKEGHTIVLTTHYLDEAEALCSRIAMLKQGEVVALDTTQNMLKKHDKKYARFKASLHMSLKGLNFPMVEQQDGYYTVSMQDYGELETVLNKLRMANIKIEELELVQPDLEQIFVQIMNKS